MQLLTITPPLYTVHTVPSSEITAVLTLPHPRVTMHLLQRCPS